MAKSSMRSTWINQMRKTQLPDIPLPLKSRSIYYPDCVMIQLDSIPQRVANYLLIIFRRHEGTPLILAQDF
jgi:hypothetical protein|tara:strand:+ start:1926 stop:2138 length:213 start_codon:yes stop_codon:yes gene_type:complete